jgi:hypothetical protein
MGFAFIEVAYVSEQHAGGVKREVPSGELDTGSKNKS